MKHMEAGRKLGVGPSHRRALLRSLTLAILEQDSIQTTPARAKELRWFAERIVTLAKRADVSSRRRIVQLLGSSQSQKGRENRVRSAIERVYSDLVPRFKTRNGGYTQILRLAMNRVGDNAEQCIIRYIPEDDAGKDKSKAKKSAKGGDKGEAKKKQEAKTPAKKEAKAEAQDKKAPKEKKETEPQDKPVSKKSEKEKA